MKNLEISINCGVYPQYFKPSKTVVFQNEDPNFNIETESYIEVVLEFNKENNPQAYELLKDWDNENLDKYDMLVKQDDSFYLLKSLHVFFKDIVEKPDKEMIIFTTVLTYANVELINNVIDCGDNYIINL